MIGRRSRAVLAAGLAALAGLALAGCSLGGSPGSPGSTRSTRSTRSAGAASSRASTSPTSGSTAAKLAQARRTHEYPAPAPRQSVVGGWHSPARAVQVFATTYVNWSAATVAARLRSLAQVSVGQARSAMSQAAGAVARDTELRRGGIVNSGTVEAIGPVAGRRDAYAVVTRERTSAAHDDAYRGLAPAWHVAIATVTRVGGRLWVLSGWQPEN